jgi:hypothetical protein
MTNKRKFRYWDNKLIFHSLQRAIQIKHKIEEQCKGQEVDPYTLPMSLVPTHILYDLTACYEAMYDKLLDEELITSGYTKTQPTLH